MRHIALISVSVLLLGSAAATPAAAAPQPPKPVTTVSVGAASDPANLAASAVMRWLDAHPQSGAGEISLDAASGSITVGWKGAVPAGLRVVAAAQPVPVTFHTVPFSAAQLDREAAQIAKANPTLVASVGPLPDGSGLGVQLASSAVAKGLTRADLRTGLTAAIPVTVTGTADLLDASRVADTPPFWGGALIYSTGTGYYCSSGVSVYSGTASYLTTAGHCGAGPWFAPGSGYKIGDVGTSNTGVDTELIKGSSYDPVVYNAAWDSSTGIAVYDSERPADGSRICTDGAVTGEQCASVNVHGIMQYVNIGGVGTVGPGFWILGTATVKGVQVGIAQPGDSGSPAYAYTSASQASVRGLTVAVDLTFRTAQCGGNPSFSHAKCSSRAFAVNSVDALSKLGVRIKTAS